MLDAGETTITGEQHLARLKESGRVRLSANQFIALWENNNRIPESWKEGVDGNIRYIYFDGTVLRGDGNNRYVLCLYRENYKWNWTVKALNNIRHLNDLSAVMA